MEPYLVINNLEIVYNDVILVLKGISLEAPEGSVIREFNVRFQKAKNTDFSEFAE